VTPEEFARFLELLSPDTEEAGRRYICLHKKLIGFFEMKGISDPVSCADETITRAILKTGAGTLVTSVDSYCFGIARNIAREKYRDEQREILVFTKFIKNNAGISLDEEVERIYNLLKPCFEQLPAEEKKLLFAYCEEMHGRARTEHRQRLAERMKITMATLRVRVTRLRNNLTECVRKRANRV
jgi:hypothetical protein